MRLAQRIKHHCQKANCGNHLRQEALVIKSCPLLKRYSDVCAWQKDARPPAVPARTPAPAPGLKLLRARSCSCARRPAEASALNGEAKNIVLDLSGISLSVSIDILPPQRAVVKSRPTQEESTVGRPNSARMFTRSSGRKRQEGWRQPRNVSMTDKSLEKRSELWKR